MSSSDGWLHFKTDLALYTEHFKASFKQEEAAKAQLGIHQPSVFIQKHPEK